MLGKLSDVIGRCIAMLAGLGLLAMSLGNAAPVPNSQADQPAKVVIPGTIQKLLGCPADWQSDCDKTALQYDAAADLWSATFDLPAGDYEYKVAINGTW